MSRGSAQQKLIELGELISKANSIVLTTHRQCDGDGLGGEIALFHALKKISKDVRILNVDGTPAKYSFLLPQGQIQYFEEEHEALQTTDLGIVLDTNDERMLEPLYPVLNSKCHQLVYLDHHPLLKSGPQPTEASVIDTTAASTGELVFDLLNIMNIQLDENISRAIYASIVFDTQIFRYIRSSPRSHEICAELLKFEKAPDVVHRNLFGTYTVEKMSFLSTALSQIEYYCDGRLAILRLNDDELIKHGMIPDESRDIIDFIMNIASLEAAALFREDGQDEFKLSMRSKGSIEVLGVAEAFAGGGHLYAAGSFVKGDYNKIKAKVLKLLQGRIEGLPQNESA